MPRIHPSSSAGSAKVAIACGGTGGHLFPGLAVAGELAAQGLSVQLMVSRKDVDQLALQGESRFEVVRLAAMAMDPRSPIARLRALWSSYRQCRKSFQEQRPVCVLAMGGFTSVAPLLAGFQLRTRLLLHESNAIPGRANRCFSRWVDEAFVGFREAAPYLKCQRITLTGTPVRTGFVPPASPSPARVALGLDALRPVLLVTGGSQGAHAVNQAMLGALETLGSQAPELQYLHLTGPSDCESVEQAYARLGLTARVFPFLARMELAFGAATLVVARAGGSSLAELAAMRAPSILIPYPFAADDHQTANATAFERTGAAQRLPQSEATPARLSHLILQLLRNPSALERMGHALESWHFANASRDIAGAILKPMGRTLDRSQGLMPAPLVLG